MPGEGGRMISEKIAGMLNKGEPVFLTICVHNVAQVPVPQTCHTSQVISTLKAPVLSYIEKKGD